MDARQFHAHNLFNKIKAFDTDISYVLNYARVATNYVYVVLVIYLLVNLVDVEYSIIYRYCSQVCFNSFGYLYIVDGTSCCLS